MASAPTAGGRADSSATIADLRERVARLEALVQQLSRRR
jgi:hypothetical protein